MRVCSGCAGHGKGLQAGAGIRSAGSNPARFPAKERVGDRGCRCKSRLRNTNRQRFQRRDFADRKLFRTFADVFPAEGCARMVESVDTPDLKSCGQQWPCRFDPGSGYQQKKSQKASTVVWDFAFWPAAAIYNRSSFRHKQEISDKRPVQSIRLGQMVQLPSDKCLDIIV